MIDQSEPRSSWPIRTDRSYGEFEVLPWMMIWLFQWLSVPFYPEAILQNRALLPLALFATAAWYKPAVSIELLKKYFIGDSILDLSYGKILTGHLSLFFYFWRLILISFCFSSQCCHLALIYCGYFLSERSFSADYSLWNDHAVRPTLTN